MTILSTPITSPILTALSTLHDGISDMVFYKDLDGVYLGCNQAFCDFAGHAHEADIIGITNVDLFDQETADFFRAQELSVLSTNTAKHSYERVTDAKGNKVVLDSIKMPLRDSKGNVVGILGISCDVTDNHQAQTALQNNQKAQQQNGQKYQLLFEASSEAMLIISPPLWHFSEANQAALELFGISSLAEFTPLDLSKVSPQRQPDDSLSIEAMQQNIATAMSKGSTFFEWVFQQSDGTPFFAAVNLTRMEAANEVFLHCVVRDNSERKKIEQALQESEDKYRCLFHTSEDPMWLAIDNRFLMANHASAQLLGYDSIDTLIGLHPAKISPEFQADGQTSYKKANAMMAIAHREGFHRFEWNHKKRNGEVFPLDISLTRVPYEGREALICIARDITKHKLAAQELAEKEAQFRSLVENIPGSTYRGLLDKHWPMIFVSNAIETLSGYPAADFIGVNPVRNFSNIIHPDDAQLVWDNISAAVSEKVSYTCEYRIINKQGLINYIYETGQASYTNDGSPKYLDGTLYDITERKQLEALEKCRSNVMEVIATEDAFTDIMKGICLCVEQQYPGLLCSILLLDNEGKRLLIGGGHPACLIFIIPRLTDYPLTRARAQMEQPLLPASVSSLMISKQAPIGFPIKKWQARQDWQPVGLNLSVPLRGKYSALSPSIIICHIILLKPILN